MFRTRNPELNYLYGNIPEPQWQEEVWYAKLVEVIDNYSPDLIFFDSWLLHWEMLEEGLKIRIPRSGLDEKATVLKISYR